MDKVAASVIGSDENLVFITTSEVYVEDAKGNFADFVRNTVVQRGKLDLHCGGVGVGPGRTAIHADRRCIAQLVIIEKRVAGLHRRRDKIALLDKCGFDLDISGAGNARDPA